MSESPPGASRQVPADFHEHLAGLAVRGLVRTIDRPIDKDSELHPLARWQFQGGLADADRRAFVFTHVTGAKGERYGMPVVVGALAASPEIYAAGLGVAVEDIGRVWVRAVASPIAPELMTEGVAPCQEVVETGDSLEQADGGLARLPVPVSTPGFDAAPYLTATLCVTRDPESGIQNMGTYRAGLKASNRLGVRMATRLSGAGGYVHWQKYRALGQPMPIAIVVGASPAVMFTGPQKLAIDMDELAVAGGLMGRAIRTVRCKTVDLVVPADAEIVIEGLIDTALLEPEGPFGESHGHVALEDFNMSMQVTAITRRRDAVFVSIVSQVTPSESSVLKKVAYEPMFLEHLRTVLGVRGVTRVVMHEPLSNLRKVIFVQYARGVPRTEVWRGMHGAASLQAQCGKLVIAVSEDIDPENADAIFWSLAYRSNFDEDVLVMGNRAAGHGPKSGRAPTEGTLLIDATLKHDMPPLALPAEAYMTRAKAIWEELDFPRLTPQSPWHGYPLGDWAPEWAAWAEAAVKGDWRAVGDDTFARRRGGIKPETPVREGGPAAME